MTFENLISASQLASALAGQQKDSLLIVDCSFDLADAQAGRRAYEAGHIPSATYVSLEDTLSAAKTGRNGRHPLPDREAFARHMASLGVSDETQVVACDNASGMYAARLWWMLRWTGHAAVAVLDGGIAAWKAAGHSLSTDRSAAREPHHFTLRPSLVTTVTYDELRTRLGRASRLVLDARAADRFRGENESLDPVGGHIPGALNRPFRDNLSADGRFKPADELRDEFRAVAGARPVSEMVSQCGSGVTACHNLLAMEVAGLRGAALYPGSWSEWCTQPGAPIATGSAG